MHERETSLLAVDHISGLFNVVADFASREHTTNPADFLHTFSQKFPPPKNCSWTLFQFNEKMKSLIFSLLRQETLTMASWKRLGLKGNGFSKLGRDGSLTPSPVYDPTFKTSAPNHSWTCWQPTQDMLDAAAFHLENTKFAPKPSRWHYEVS